MSLTTKPIKVTPIILRHSAPGQDLGTLTDTLLAEMTEALLKADLPRVRIVDEGIGSCEAHGFRGTHHDWQPEVIESDPDSELTFRLILPHDMNLPALLSSLNDNFSPVSRRTAPVNAEHCSDEPQLTAELTDVHLELAVAQLILTFTWTPSW